MAAGMQVNYAFRSDHVFELTPPIKMAEQKNILFVWELGGAMGHLARLAPIARRLHKQGHRVRMALKSAPPNRLIPGEIDVVPVPGMPAPRDPISQPVSMADVLYNVGVGDAGWLCGQVRFWRGLFNATSPDVVVLDYSPTALLALQGTGVPVLQVGTGFASPPAVSPLPDLRAWQNHYPDRIRATENRVLSTLNAQLERQQQPALHCVGELFGRVDANVLATFPELDHYPEHPRGEYWGTWGDASGVEMDWPEGDSPRVFAYLKPYRGLHQLLDALARRSLRCLVHVGGLNDGSRGGSIDARRWQATSVRVSAEPLDIANLVKDCDLGIINAGHASTATLLLAGVPLLQLPIQIEQYHNAEATQRLGAGLHVELGDLAGFCDALDELLGKQKYRGAAINFARRHADHDSEARVGELVEKIIGLANLPLD